MRTIKQFIGQANHIYFKMSNREICKQFYEQAAREGMTLGGINPTYKETTDLVAILPDGNLCYVGWAGRMCYHNSREGVIKIDYEKYSKGEAEYLIR